MLEQLNEAEERANAHPASDPSTCRRRKDELMSKIMPAADRRGKTPDFEDRVRLARSILSHRFDETDPDVLVLTRALDGWTMDELAAGEVGAA